MLTAMGGAPVSPPPPVQSSGRAAQVVQYPAAAGAKLKNQGTISAINDKQITVKVQNEPINVRVLDSSMLRVGDRVVLRGNMLTALGTATGSSQQGQGQIQPPEEQTIQPEDQSPVTEDQAIQPEDQPPVTEGQTDEERNAAKREAKEKMKKERAGAEQQPTYKKMDFGFDFCGVQFGDVMRGVSEDDMIRLATEAGAEGFTYQPKLKYGSLIIGSYPAGCKSPAEMSWPLYLKKEPGGAEQQTTAQYSAADSTYRFNPQNLIIDEFKSGWAVKDSTYLNRAIHPCRQENRDNCEQVLQLLQFYGINEQIYAAGNGMTFYLSSGNAPSGPYTGESCTQFDPQALTIRQGTVVSTKFKGTPDWEILENGKLFFRILGSAGPSDEPTARRIVDLIQQTGICYRCNLGTFDYLRK